MRRLTASLLIVPALLLGCAHRNNPTKATLAELHDVNPDLQNATVDQGLDHAMEAYRRFLEQTPQTEMTPEAMRRLADLEIEKQFGIRTGDGKPKEMAAPERAKAPRPTPTTPAAGASQEPAESHESDEDFERRTTAEGGALAGGGDAALPADVVHAGGDPAGPLEAIALYDRLLTEYPNYAHSDQVLYQKARAYDELGRTEEAMETMEQLIRANPHSEHLDEVQFRRGEYFFTRRKFRDAENAYSAIIGLGADSQYFELALYKLGWTLYKQEMYEEALHKYMALLDHKVSIGYDFDQTHAEDDERRVADTYRVISFAFSNLGGPDAVKEYFATFLNRPYEDRVYSNLGEHYLDKLRYDDAAKTYRTFVALYPFHKSSPRFSMRVVDIFTHFRSVCEDFGAIENSVMQSNREDAKTKGAGAFE